MYIYILYIFYFIVCFAFAFSVFIICCYSKSCLACGLVYYKIILVNNLKTFIESSGCSSRNLAHNQLM